MSVQVEIKVAGDGLSYPKKFQVVTIHYTAWTESPKGDGALVEFDSTHKRGKPLTFQLGAEQVIRGLEEGVSQLSVGDRAKITIPSSMGYGKKGFPGLIAPNAKMVFDIEMLGCVDATSE
eukprot:INCI11851.1.p1 GENE.INCI11851.1~~INCI11851.1.p1  ORF type:complete len:120 (-),score=15.32 INCI11851.1:134-493(-)